MTTVVQKLEEGYRFIIEECADDRTKDWFLVGGPGPVLVIMGAYLYFCTKLGPRIMQNREPFELKNVLIVYNAFQVILSTYLFCQGARALFSLNFNYFCEPLDFSRNPTSMKIASLVWLYYIAKYTELLDTVFFVLRKKYSQVTFLHLYHHASMPLVTWMGARYFASGHGCLTGLLNSFVHIVMYTYYLISGLGPEYQKYLWWKKHVTTIQLIQFSILWVHNFFVMFTDCKYPKVLHLIIVLESSFFLYQFGKFYLMSYNKRNNNSDKKLLAKEERRKTKAKKVV